MWNVHLYTLLVDMAITGLVGTGFPRLAFAYVCITGITLVWIVEHGGSIIL